MKPTIEATIEYLKEECNSDYAGVAIEALRKQGHTCENCSERDSDGWCEVVNVSCDILEYCGCWSEVESDG